MRPHFLKPYLFIVLSIGPCLNLKTVLANDCSSFINSSFETQIQEGFKEQSVRKLMSGFKVFKKSYHERYDRYLNQLLVDQPDLNANPVKLREEMQIFYLLEGKSFEDILQKILQLPAKKRIHYLRSLSLDKLLEIAILLDPLLGLNKSQMELIQEPSSIWPQVLKDFELLDFENLNEKLVVNKIPFRLSLLIGLLHPEIRLEIPGVSVYTTQIFNQLARQNGFTNIKFLNP